MPIKKEECLRYRNSKKRIPCRLLIRTVVFVFRQMSFSWKKSSLVIFAVNPCSVSEIFQKPIFLWRHIFIQKQKEALRKERQGAIDQLKEVLISRKMISKKHSGICHYCHCYVCRHYFLLFPHITGMPLFYTSMLIILPLTAISSSS